MPELPPALAAEINSVEDDAKRKHALGVLGVAGSRTSRQQIKLAEESAALDAEWLTVHPLSQQAGEIRDRQAELVRLYQLNVVQLAVIDAAIVELTGLPLDRVVAEWKVD
jgi:hypothetical protein